MKGTLARAAVVPLIVPVLLTGCEPGPTLLEPLTRGPAYSIGLGVGATGGAVVSYSGEGPADVSCSFGEFATTQGTAVHSPSGNATLECQFSGLAPIPWQETLMGWLCTLNEGGTIETRQSQWVRSPTGSAQLTCHFSGKPVNDAAVDFGAGAAPAQQASFTTPLYGLPGKRRAGELVDIGHACTGDPLANPPFGKVALLERGNCPFSEQLANAMLAGAIAAIVYNDAAGGDEIITMGGPYYLHIPSVFVARSTGLALRAAAPIQITLTYCLRSATCRGEL